MYNGRIDVKAGAVRQPRPFRDFDDRMCSDDLRTQRAIVRIALASGTSSASPLERAPSARRFRIDVWLREICVSWVTF